MKKISFLFIAFLTISFSGFSQNSEPIKNADGVGKYTLNLLKNFENTSEEEFVNSLMTTEDIIKFAEKVADTAVGNNLKKEITKMGATKYYNRVAEVYHDLKEKGKEYGIVWKDIAYVDFTYELRDKKGIKGIEGALVFSCKGTKYKVKTDALYDGDAYLPIIVRKLYKKDDD